MKKKNLIYKIVVLMIGSGIFSLLLFFSLKYNWNFSFIFKDLLYFPITIGSRDKELKFSFDNYNLELLNEINELKQLMNIESTLTEFNFVNATVINRNTSYWNEELIINKGSSDKISKGMAVVDSKGLIGRVIKVSKTTSTIKLITAKANDNKISVKIWNSNNSINKVLEQDQNNNLIISGIDNNFELKIGDIVTTSGLSDIYPSGITIGKIQKIEDDKFGISKKAYVTHLGDLNNVRFVAVLIRR